MARRVLAIAVAVYLLLVLLDRFVLVQLLVERIGVPFLLACAGALACIGTGFLLRRQNDIALNFIVGYPIFGTICFLIGLLKISTWTMVPVVGILGGIGLLGLVEDGRPRLSGTAEGRCPPLEAIAIGFVALTALIAAQAPPASLDELAYHLAVPWTWVKEARAVALPLVSHSYFPLGVESADLPFLAILGTGGGIASHFLHLFAAVATTALLLRAAGRNHFIVAAIITTPALVLTAGWSLVDWNLLGVAVALVMALEADDRATITAALGAGLLTKYTFIPLAIICVWTGFSRSSRNDRLKPVRTLLPGVAIGSVFFMRNLILTGNPFAPFFTAFAPHVAHYRAGAFLSDYIFDGRFIDESLGASMLMACTLSAGLLSWILVAAGIALFFLSPSARLLVPFFAIPAARATTPGRVMRWLLAIAIAVQLFLVGYFAERTEAFGLLAGRVSDEQYLTKARPSYATIAAVDAALPAQSRTLVVGLTETYWFQHRVRGGGNFDGPRISAYLETPTPEALRDRLRHDGITHVAVISAPPSTAVAKKIEERETALTPEAQRSLAQMLDRYAASVTQRGSAALFTLR